MSFIQNIQSHFFAKSLQKKFKAKVLPPQRLVSFESANTVGMLFNATELPDREFALDYAKDLKKRGKKVKLLGFFDNKLDNPNFTFRHFNRKDIDWALRPRGEFVEEFLTQDFDLFINLATESFPYSEYIAALTRASLRVGPCTANTFCYDLMIDLAGRKDLKSFIQQVELILKKTNTRYEAAKI